MHGAWAVVATAALCLVVASCDAADPHKGNGMHRAVATVDGVTIWPSTLRRYLRARYALRGDSLRFHSPPSYQACVSAQKKRQVGGPTRSNSELRRHCSRELRRQYDRAVGFLIRAEWLDRAARTLPVGDVVSASRAAGAKQNKWIAEAGTGFSISLQRAGATQRYREALLRSGVIERLLLARVQVTAADIMRYYEVSPLLTASAHAGRLRYARGSTEAVAARIKRGILREGPWDTESRGGGRTRAVSNRGRKPAVSMGPHGDPALERAVPQGKAGLVVGPLRTPEGWYVLQVVGIDRLNSGGVMRSWQAIIRKIRARKLRTQLHRRVGTHTVCARGYRRRAIPECL